MGGARRKDEARQQAEQEVGQAGEGDVNGRLRGEGYGYGG